jgi:hypothetical protein
VGDVGERKPWERQPGEKAMWYSRFDTYYRPLGPAYNAWRKKAEKGGTKRSVAKSWELNARKWNWQERAEAWDEAERQRRHAEEEEERRKDRRERIRLLKAYRDKLERALQALEPESAKWAEVTAGLRMVNDELRSEYGDQPAQQELKIEQTVNLNFLEDLTDEEHEAIEAALRSQAAGSGQAQ